MKVTFEFDTNREDFYESFDHCKLYNVQQAQEMACCLNELATKIRSVEKWDSREAIPIEEISNFFWESMKEHGLDFERMGY